MNQVVVWDLESRRQLVALAGEGSMFNAVRFSPDGNVIGSRNSRDDVYLWRAPPFQETATAKANRQTKIHTK
jgi:hypothetical protein